MTDPFPSKDQLKFSWTWDVDACTWRISTIDMGDGMLAGYEHLAGYYERRLIEEIERLRTTLRGIQSCSTCEACRGAATLALGDPLETETRAATSRRAHGTEDAGRSRPFTEREMPHCSTCSCPPYEAPGIPAHLEMLAKGVGGDTSNAPTEETQQKVISAVNYHAREIARLTETWPVQSYTAYDIELFDAGRGVAARMRPEQNGRYYLRSDVDSQRASQPPEGGQ